MKLHPWLIVGVCCLAALAGQIDASIVQLTLPTLERVFAAPLDIVSWVAVAYVLAFACALPVFARLSETGNRKRIYLLGFLLFGAASVLCGFAPSLPLLILFRALQGIAGGALGANSVVILVAGAGSERRGQAMGFFSTAQAAGISLGPALGGVLLASLTWHWVFWITAPICVLAAILGWILIPGGQQTQPAPFDLPGALLLIPALGALLTAIVEFQAWGPSSPYTLGCFAVALVLLPAFVWRERRAPAPLLALGLFRSWAFSGGSVAIVLSYAMLYAMFFAMSFALVRGYHDSPVAAGARLTIIPLALGLVAPLSGALAERHLRVLLIAGMAICFAATLELARVMTGAPGSLTPVMLTLAAYGAGLGLFIAPNNTATLAAAPATRAGQAGGILNLARSFGTGIGVACASAVLAWRLERATGLHEQTLAARSDLLLAAVSGVLLMLAGFACLAALTSCLGGGRRAALPGGQGGAVAASSRA